MGERAGHSSRVDGRQKRREGALRSLALRTEFVALEPEDMGVNLVMRECGNSEHWPRDPYFFSDYLRKGLLVGARDESPGCSVCEEIPMGGTVG